MSYPSCKGDCKQGDRICLTPEECRDDPLGLFRGLVSAFIITAACVFVGYLIAQLW